MAKPKKNRHVRSFLTGPEEADSYIHLTMHAYGGYDLKIADCHRTVSLGFADHKSSLKKAKKLRDVVDVLINEIELQLSEQTK